MRDHKIFLLFTFTLTCMAFFSTDCNLYAQSKPGEKIYLQKCAKCHGSQGQGDKTHYPESLIGDLSIKELTRYIDETMPDEKPETCVGEEAAAVAAHIHHAFYSITAQARNKPAEITFSRLTNRQYRNSVADLANTFLWSQNFGEKRGLAGKYYKNRSERKSNIVIERVDPVIQLSFQEKNKPHDKMEFDAFTVNWHGGIYAPETGLYEFILKTKNGGLLWFNESKKPVLDATVKSGDNDEYRITVFLLGGRTYSVYLELSKSKTEKEVSFELKWKPPHQSEQVIPSRYLSPEYYPEVLVIETPFPPDDKSVGYERGISISKQWNDATTFAAVEAADKLLSQIDEYAKLGKNPKKREEKLRKFCETFATRAFRRPLSKELKAKYIDRQFERNKDPLVATRRVILLVLKSPRFLFLGIPGDGDSKQEQQYRVAEWLAITLWDSIPNQEMLDQAAEGKLVEDWQIQSMAKEMVQDDRTRSKVREFFHQWLQYDHYYDLEKSQKLYPGFDEHFASDLRISLDLLIEEIVWNEKSDFHELLSTNSIYLNGRLAKFYGVDLPADAQFQRVSFDPEHRAGLISHPFLMAGLAYEKESSPIHRGVFLARSLMGRFLKPPPIAVAPLEVKLTPDLTTRQRVALQTKGVVCGSCHGLINPLGFALENYDAAGRFRTKDNGKSVDTKGIYIDREGNETEIQGAKALTKFLLRNPDTHAAFAEQLFQYLTKQPTQAFGDKTLLHLRKSFEKKQNSMQFLLAEIAAKSAIANREISRKKKD